MLVEEMKVKKGIFIMNCIFEFTEL